MESTRERTATPHAARRRRATAPAATLAAVSLALARSSTSRRSARSYLSAPGQVGVPRARRAHRLGRAREGLWAHAPRPVGEVAVLDAQRDGRAEGLAAAHARLDADDVALDLHAPAAAVAALSPREVAVDVLGEEGRPAGTPSMRARREGPWDSPAVDQRRWDMMDAGDCRGRRGARRQPGGADQRPRDSARFTMRGVMKISSSLRRSLWRRRWKSAPRIGMSPSSGHALHVAAGVAGVDPADDRGAPVLDEQVGLGLAAEDGGVAAGAGVVEVRLVAVDANVHRDRPVGGHVRPHAELELGLLEGRLDARGAHLRVGDEGALRDGRLAVVEGQDARRAHDAQHAGALRGREAHVEVEAVADGAQREAERTAGASRRSRPGG
jgi:hypothetical protein